MKLKIFLLLSTVVLNGCSNVNSCIGPDGDSINNILEQDRIIEFIGPNRSYLARFVNSRLYIYQVDPNVEYIGIDGAPFRDYLDIPVRVRSINRDRDMGRVYVGITREIR